MDNERPTEQQIEAARRAVMEAPKTETGILIPPHVAAELAAKDADRDRADAGGPAHNRAQRRAHQRRLKKIQKRNARSPAAAAVHALEQETAQLQPVQRSELVAMLEAMRGASRQELKDAMEQLQAGKTPAEIRREWGGR